jgi:hypothetical protein
MLARFFCRFTPSHAHVTPTNKLIAKLDIGRLSPEATYEHLETEIKTELSKVGINQLRQTIKAEESALDLMMQTRKNYMEQFRNCSNELQQRFKKDQCINGLFWQEQQKVMNGIVPKEKWTVLEEQIDWLTARQQLFKDLDSSSYEFNTSPSKV